MTSAYAEWPDLDAAAADVAPGHPVTVHPPGRPALRLVTPTDWAVGELLRVMREWAPAAAIDWAAELSTGREPGEVYSFAFEAVGVSFGEAEKRAIGLTRAVDRVLRELYDALGPGADLVAVVPQLRHELVAAGRAETLDVLQATPGFPADWAASAGRGPAWLQAHPAG